MNIMKKLAAIGALLAAFTVSHSLFAGEPSQENKQNQAAPTQGLAEQHKVFERWAGTWDVKHTMHTENGPVISYGKEVDTLILDGRAIHGQYEAKGEQGAFKGQGITTWNPQKKQYQSYWLDIYSANGGDISYGTYDEANKTLTSYTNTQDEKGNPIEMKMVSKEVNANKMQLAFYVKAKDGKEQKTMEIEYTRAKK